MRVIVILMMKVNANQHPIATNEYKKKGVGRLVIKKNA